MKNPEPPDWARPLTAEKWALFVTTLGDTLDAIHAGDQRAAIGEGILRLRNSAGSEESYGLQNLAQILALESTAEWPRLVAEHFDAMLTVDEPVTSGEEAIKLLRIRMWHPDYVEQSPEAIHKVLAPGLVLALVLDLPNKVMSLKNDELKAWGLTAELAWSAAEENSKREQYEVIPQTRPDGTQMIFLTGDNLYVTSNALWLDERIELDSEHGALIGVPTRHLLVVLPIRDINVVKAVGAMHAANRRIFEEGPGSISGDLYWWRQRTFTLFPIDASAKPMQVRPPDKFVEMLNRLAPGAKS